MMNVSEDREKIAEVLLFRASRTIGHRTGAADQEGCVQR